MWPSNWNVPFGATSGYMKGLRGGEVAKGASSVWDDARNDTTSESVAWFHPKCPQGRSFRRLFTILWQPEMYEGSPLRYII